MAEYVLIFILVITNMVNGLFYDELMSDCHGLPFRCMMSKQTTSGGTQSTSGSDTFSSSANLFQSKNQQQQQQQQVSIQQTGLHNYNSGFVPGGLGINPADMSAVLKKQGKTEGPFVIKTSMNMSPFNPNTNGGGQSTGKGPFGGGNSNIMNGMMGGMGSGQGNGGISGMQSMTGSMGSGQGNGGISGMQSMTGSMGSGQGNGGISGMQSITGSMGSGQGNGGISGMQSMTGSMGYGRGNNEISRVQSMTEGINSGQGNSRNSGIQSIMGMTGGRYLVHGVSQGSGSGSSSMLADCDKDWMSCPQNCIKSNPVLGCVICTCRKTSEVSELNGINEINSHGKPKPGTQTGRVHASNGTPNPTRNEDSKCTSLPKTCPGHCVEFTQLGCLTCGCDLEPEPEMCPYFPECPRGFVKMDFRGCAVCTFKASKKSNHAENTMDWYRKLWGN